MRLWPLRRAIVLAAVALVAAVTGACDGPVITPSSSPSVGLSSNASNPVKLGTLVTFSVTASIPGKPANISIQNIHLDFGDGQSADLGETPPLSGVSHAYGLSGTFTAAALVTDTLGHQAKASLTIVVGAASPPSVGLTSDASNPTPIGKVVTFTVTASIPGVPGGNVIANVHLDFGDGQSADLGAVPPTAGVPHTYATAGTFTPTATAIDTNNKSTSASVTIVVK